MEFFADADDLEPIQSVLAWNQVDGILRYIYSLESVVNTRSEDVSANIQNFGVFSIQPNCLVDSVQESSFTNSSTVKPVRRTGEYEFMADPDIISLVSTGIDNYPKAEVAWDLCNPSGHDFVLEFPQDHTAVDPLMQALPKVTQSLSNDTLQLLPVGFEESYTLAGLKYRCDAIGLLKYAVETDLYADIKPRYKEILATMLSMITINVISGDTRTCSVHLDGAEKLITHMAAQKSSFSRKAQSLHRINIYLRVIYESTAVKRQRNSSSRFTPWLGSAKAVGLQPMLRSTNPLIEEEDALSMMPMECTAQSQTPPSNISAYECIYGIPEKLLLLLKQSIEVIDEVNYHRFHQINIEIQGVP
ncbi:hypothetical protein PENANT_c011G09695 [Penicillium antarcticum]|uniref:Transcription factor domain-containing protein n=1 Tax=Penicillium antarcticum TaxID=416450 RepID=A0A1V6Q740_9EURO|nr:hypothetical protein PENANT_c011G09695 [Penicillium antarcticum]